MSNSAPYAEVAYGLRIRLADEISVGIGDTTYLGLELDLGPRSVDGWLARLAAAEMQAEQDGLLDEGTRSLVVHGGAKELSPKEF